MAKFPRRGKGSDKSNEGKISNSVSASDGKSGRADEAYTPSTPKPPQPPKNGRTDLNGPQGFRRAQEIANHTTPQMSRRERTRIENMKGPAPQPSAPGPVMGMGSSSSSEEDPRNASITDDELSALARQSVDASNEKGEQPDWSWMSETTYERFDEAVGKEMAIDEKKAQVQEVAGKLSLEDLNSLSVEGRTIERDGVTYFGKSGLIVVDNGLSEAKKDEDDPRPHLQPADLHDAITARLANEPAETSARWAVFLPLENDKRLQFTDSSMSSNKASEDLLHLRGVLIANDEKVIADRLTVSDLTDDEIKAERELPPQDQPRHERAFAEAAQREFSSLSIPPSDTLSGKDHMAVGQAFDEAPALAPAENGVSRDEVADRSPEGLQKHADRMFDEGRDLRDIYSDTRVKPEGADQTAWERTEYVYGQPTALDRLQELGTGAFAVSPTGYTYAMSADGKELIRFDADGNPAGQKPVEDVQAFLQEKRGVEFDQRQEEKAQEENKRLEESRLHEPAADMKSDAALRDDMPEVSQDPSVENAAEAVAQPDAVVENRMEADPLSEITSSAQNEVNPEATQEAQQELSSSPNAEPAAAIDPYQEAMAQARENSAEHIAKVDEMANQPPTESQQETLAVLRGDVPEAQRDQSVQADAAMEAKPDPEMVSELPTVVESNAPQETEQEQVSLQEAEAQPQVASLSSEAQSSEIVSEQAPANEREVSNEPSSQPSQQQQPEQSADVGHDTLNKSVEGPELEMSPSKSKDVEEDKVRDPDHKLETTNDAQSEQQSEKKPDSPEVAEARAIFNKMSAQQEAKETNAEKVVDRSSSTEASQQAELNKEPELERDPAPAGQNAEPENMETKSPAPAANVATPPQNNGSPQTSEAREVFNKACEQQDHKEAAQAQQPQISEDEERRRGPELEPA